MAVGDRFEGNPITGEGTFYRDGYEPVVGHVSEFFDGRLTVSNGRFTDLGNIGADGRPIYNPITIGQQGDFSVAELQDSRFDLWSVTSRGVANRQLGNKTLRMVQGSIELMGADGVIQQYAIQPMPINNIDHTWLAYITNDGTTAFVNWADTYSSTADVQRDLGPRYRLATPEEAAAQSIAKSLYLNNFDLIKDYAEENDLRKGDNSLDLSGAVRQIMRLGDYAELTYYARTIVGS